MRRNVAAVALALLLIASRAHAQTAPVEIDRVEVGFDSWYVEDRWTPVFVTLRTPPRSPGLKGRVVLDPLPFERVSAFEAPFEIPASPEGSLLRVCVAVFANIHGDQSFSVRVEDERGHELASKVPTTHHVSDRDFLIVVSRISGLTAFGEQSLTRAGAIGTGIFKLARLGSEKGDDIRDRFPTRSSLLQGASAIVLAHDMKTPLDALLGDADRMTALEEWVSGGGTLIVIGGGKPFWERTALEPLMPVRLADPSRPIKEAPRRALDYLGPGHGPASVSDVVLTDDARLLPRSNADAPMCYRAHKRGRVAFVAFDPDEPVLRGAAELTGLCRSLIQPARSSAPAIREDRLGELSSKLFQEVAPLGVPGLTGIALAALLSAIIAGPLAARRRGRPGQVLLAPLLSAGVALAVVVVASLTRKPPGWRAVAYATVESSSLPDELRDANVVEDVALVAGDSTTFEVDLAKLDATTGRTEALPMPLERPKPELVDFRARRTALVVVPGKPLRLSPVDLLPKGLAVVRVGARAPLPPELRVRARFERADSGEPSVLVLDAAKSAGSVPAGLALMPGRDGKLSRVTETPRLEAGAQGVKVRFDQAPADTSDLTLRIQRDQDGPPIWERSPEEAERALLLRTLHALEAEIAARGKSGNEPPPAPIWLALPGPAPELAQPLARRRGTASELSEIKDGRALGVYLFAAEGP